MIFTYFIGLFAAFFVKTGLLFLVTENEQWQRLIGGFSALSLGVLQSRWQQMVCLEAGKEFGFRLGSQIWLFMRKHHCPFHVVMRHANVCVE